MNGQEDSRPQGRRAGLSRQVVLDAAMALIDRDGLGALSMRRLGAELGVEAMTLYHHVGNKEALLDGLVERLLDEIVPEIRDAPSWRTGLREFAHSLHGRLLAHPALLPVVATRPAVTHGTLDMLERALETLRPAGFSPERGLEIIHAVIGLVLGHVGVSGASGDSGGRARLLAARDLTDFPLLREAVGAAGAAGPGSPFDVALEAMLTGFDHSSAPPEQGVRGAARGRGPA